MGAGVTIGLSLEGVEPALAADLRAIAEERGRPLTLDEVSGLRARAEAVRLAFRAERAARDCAALLGRCVRVGGIELRALSLAGSIALRKLVAWAPMLDQDTYDVLEAWVYAHSWDWDAMGRLNAPGAAERIVTEWSARLTCTKDELSAAVAAVREPETPEQPEAGDSGGESDEARVLESYLATYGGDPRDWLSLPLGVLNELGAAGRTNAAVAHAKARSADGSVAPSVVDARVHASNAYLAEVGRLKAEESASG